MHGHGSVSTADLHAGATAQPGNGVGCGLAVTDGHPFDLVYRQVGYFGGPLRCFVFQLKIPPGDNAVGVFFFK